MRAAQRAGRDDQRQARGTDAGRQRARDPHPRSAPPPGTVNDLAGAVHDRPRPAALARAAHVEVGCPGPVHEARAHHVYPVSRIRERVGGLQHPRRRREVTGGDDGAVRFWPWRTLLWGT